MHEYAQQIHLPQVPLATYNVPTLIHMHAYPYKYGSCLMGLVDSLFAKTLKDSKTIVAKA